jgi:hypothetical protein
MAADKKRLNAGFVRILKNAKNLIEQDNARTMQQLK